MFGGPPAVASFTRERIQTLDTPLIVSHKLACKVQAPQQLQQVTVSGRELGAQQLAQCLAAELEDVGSELVTQNSQGVHEQLQFPGIQQKPTPGQTANGFQRVSPRVSEPLSPHVHVVHIGRVVGTRVEWRRVQ